MAIQNRQYQTDARIQLYNEIRKGYKRIVLCMPTGAGKTTTAGTIINQCVLGGKRVLICIHSEELVKQFANRLYTQFDLMSGVIMAGHKPNYSYKCQVASIQSLIRRQFPEADIIFIDEGHRSRASTYKKILDSYPDSVIKVALTATPFRGDGKSLGEMFDTIVQPVSTLELIKMGHLVPTDVYGPMDERRVNLIGVGTRMGDFNKGQLYDRYHDVGLYKGVVDNYLKNGQGKQGICFNVNIEHSINTNKEFQDAGIASEHVDGKMVKSKRRLYYNAFVKGEIKMIHNVALYTEGVDVPACEVVILNRATKSLNLYVQMVGRAARPAPNKTHAIVLDHGDNTDRFGFWEFYDDHKFDLEKPKPPGEKKVLECQCGKILSKKDLDCPSCGEMINPEPCANCFEETPKAEKICRH